jgi:hypothetical protein
VGFFLWAQALPDLSFNDQWYWIIVAGAGIGLMLGPANTDAMNRAARVAYGEVSGITQTVRNYGASLGLAVLGTLLINQTREKIESSLGTLGIPKSEADAIAQSLSQSGGGSAHDSMAQQAGSQAQQVFEAVQHDFAQASKTVFVVMAGAMLVSAVIALLGLRAGRQEAVVD